MYQGTPSIPEIIGPDELLIQGIVFRITFFRLGPEHQDPEDCFELCRIEIKGEEWESRCMMLYGHDRAQLAAEREGKEQEFLLLRRAGSDYALLLIDREGDTARRVGVASLVINAKNLWSVARPEVRLIKLT